jgi:transposase
MPGHVRPRRDFQQLERRRKQAGRLFASGKMILAAIARQLQVSRQSVSRWYTEWRSGGARALNGAGRAGRKPKLEPRKLQQVEKALRRGARANGFDTDLWTLPRVALVIERVTGVRYHPGHVWKILGAMDWTLQRPAKQARERDPKKVELWMKERWPAVKKTLGASKPGSSSRTKAASRSVLPSAQPGPRRAKTPVLIHAFNWSKMSICAAMGYRWDGRRSRLFFQTREGSYNSASLIAFLDDLKRHLRHQKAILVWDGLPAHKSRAMNEYLLNQRGWLTVERLPGYAPDLNPIETLWGNIKGQELANRCAHDLAELDTAVHGGMTRVRQSRTLPFSFLKHAGLSF